MAEATLTDPSQVNVEFSFSDLVVGTGPEAGPGSRVVMLYELWLYNPSGVASKGARQGGSSDSARPISIHRRRRWNHSRC